jgi:hypothetical protein
MCSLRVWAGLMMAIGWILKGTGLGLLLAGLVFWALDAPRGFTGEVGLGLWLLGQTGFAGVLLVEIWARR